MTLEFKVKGFQELQKELEGLDRKLKRKVLGKSVRAGSNVVKKDARAHAPKRVKTWEGTKYPNPSGTLKRGVIVRRATRQPRYIVRDLIGFDAKAWYGHLVERGHKLVRNKKVIGHVAAKPFLRPAFDNNQDKIISEMSKVFRTELDKLK